MMQMTARPIYGTFEACGIDVQHEKSVLDYSRGFYNKPYFQVLTIFFFVI